MQIFLVPFILTLALAGWMTWRRSPRYSLQGTLLVGAAILVTVGAIGGVFAGAAHMGLITTLGGVLLIVFVMAGTLALCAFILRITDGPMARVASEAAVVDVNRRKFYRIAERIGIGLLLAAACDLIPVVRPLGSILAGLLTLCAVPLLWGLHHNAVRNDRGISALMANPWVHWRFTTAEWKAVADRAREDTGKPVFHWKRNWGTGLTVAASGTGAAWISGGGTGEIVGALVFFLLFPFGVNWLVSNSANEQYRRWMAAAPQAWFGPDGLLIGDEYIPWALSGKYLLAATVRQGPPACLVFRFRIFTERADVDKLVPLPASCDPDLQLLQRQLRTVCTNARVALASA